MSAVTLEVVLLGCGASGGVPRADGDWGVCDPSEPRNRRTRCGLLLRQWRGLAGAAAEATTVLIDTAPELRQQLAEAGCPRLDAVVFSHEHADQTHGIDDVRPFAQRQGKPIPVHMDEPTAAILRRSFRYAFEGGAGYQPILIAAPTIVPPQPISIPGPGGEMVLTPLTQDHGGRPSLGFRIGGFAYSNDVVELPPETMGALEGLDLWVVDALRYRPHPTHAHVDKALAWVNQLKPRRAILTNMHIDLDYATLASQLPRGVEPGYDGQRFTLTIQSSNLP